MPFWKQLLLNLYYHGTYPVRAWNYWRAESTDHLPVIVLCYHRIADDRATPWTMSNAMFLRQIHWLQERFRFVSLEEAQLRMGRGHNSQPCISITFDDGYAENCQQAIPTLIRERIPCTYFVTLQNVLSDEPFSHDLTTGHRFAPNTPGQLRAMAAAGVEMGVHAFTHANLGPITDPRRLHYEVVAAKEALEETTGRRARFFAFPYGQFAHLNSAAFMLAKQAGYAGVCSAYGGLNFPGDDVFHLQRVVVDSTMIRLKNWVTMDPRKLHVKRFNYQKSEVGDQRSEIRAKENMATHAAL
jgi:peptidoglycan/xylan/chitin deacetylase (PgdA/CDA1 family)